MRKQTTLKKSVSLSGVGLHSGKECTVKLCPADEFDGISFNRTDVIPGSGIINVCADAVSETRLCTVIKNDHNTTVSTVEHLMAALYALGIDNLVIEVDGPELPILDGSSQPWVELIDSAGIQKFDEPVKVIRVKKDISIKEGICMARVKPAAEFSLDIFVDYPHPYGKPTQRQYDGSEYEFRKEIAKARTFCMEKDVKNMQYLGLIKGGSLDCALVLMEDGTVSNSEGVRFDDELVRHKALDCLGDFFMAGYPIAGKFEVRLPGHGMNNKLLRKLLSDEANWGWK